MTSNHAITEAIASVRQEHIDAVNSTDVELLLRGFTEDVIYLSAGAPPILGATALREYITPIYAQVSITITMEPEGLDVSGDRAVEWGKCEGEMTMEEKGRTPVNLQYMLVYRREPSGEWRISHDISTPGPT